MANLAACFCFGTLIFGIYGHQIDFKIGDDAWEPVPRNSPDDFSTEQQMGNSENILSTEENLSSTSSEYPVTLDPHPSVRSLRNKIYFSIRKGFSKIAKYDNNSKHIFDFFNRPNQSRGFIDLVFYSLEKSRKEVKDLASVLDDETSPSKEHARTVDQPSVPEQDTTKYDEILGDDIPSVTSETITRKPLEEVGLHLNKKLGALRRSGEIVEVKDFATQIVHSRDDTTKEVEGVYSTVENSEHDALPSSSNYGMSSEVPEGYVVCPEIPVESNHFTKDLSRTLFPPVKTKIDVNDEFAEEQNPYVSVQKLHKSKSVLTKEQADYIASQAVEGALGLAETIARETSQLVNRIITGALRQNAKSKTDKHGSSGTKFQN